ncbi:hypothetical protein A0H81_01553 [Grifola frondosa]|uniref:Uncharacterized protein n=1 Tax=Grifola frondosa TaxID=5627 RepID=A0A1C7MU74_GRIFR|nr:hypothetical protein A0H81_01553 [Grifola frondosa]
MSTQSDPRAQLMASSSSSSSLGKRRVPDDFDDDDNMPAQAVVAESVPRAQPTTPRMRKALQTVKTGFTPVRSSVTRPVPTYAQPSPARRATTGAPPPASITDMTNSPRKAKKGWLGKIRAGPSQSSKAASSRTSALERGQQR